MELPRLSVTAVTLNLFYFSSLSGREELFLSVTARPTQRVGKKRVGIQKTIQSSGFRAKSNVCRSFCRPCHARNPLYFLPPIPNDSDDRRASTCVSLFSFVCNFIPVQPESFFAFDLSFFGIRPFYFGVSIFA